MTDFLLRRPLDSRDYENLVRDNFASARAHVVRSQSCIDMGVYQPKPRKPREPIVRPKTIYHEFYPDDLFYKRPGIYVAKGEYKYGRPAVAYTPGMSTNILRNDYNAMLKNPIAYHLHENSDPLHFDFELHAAIERANEFRRLVPNKHSLYWENKLISDVTCFRGQRLISPHMFIRDYDSKDMEWRYRGSGYVGAALRSPSYWALRFRQLDLY